MAFLNLVESIRGKHIVQESELKSFQDFDFLAEAKKKLESSKSIPISTETTVFRASGLSKMCPREEVLRNIYQVPKMERIPAQLQITFDFGNAFNDLAQNRWFGEWGWLVGDWHCKECGAIYFQTLCPPRCDTCRIEGRSFFKYVELEVLDKEGISGHTDGIIEKDGIRKLIELKTCNSYIFGYVKKMLNRPLPAHRDQIQIYMWMFRVPVGAVVYLNKDTSEWYQFPQSADGMIVGDLISKVKSVRTGIVSKIPPPRTICAKIDCARAKACPVKKLCFELN